MRRVFFVLTIVLLFGFGEMSPMVLAQNQPSDAKAPAKGQDLDVVLNTLNETLGENRQLKAKLKELQDEAAKVMAEGNVLRGQLRLFEKEKSRIEQQSKTSADRLSVQLEELKAEAEQLKKSTGTSQQEQKVLRTQNEILSEENQKLKGVLKSAILDEEKDKYTKLIEQSQMASQTAVTKISDAEAENQALKSELAAVHFKLGNIAFDRRDFETAILHYQKTLSFEPSNSYAHHNLGIIYDYYVVNRDKAIHHYRAYLNLKPIQEHANEIRERILELRLGKAMIPDEPLKKDFYNEAHYTN